jgi:hypothetical protein
LIDQVATGGDGAQDLFAAAFGPRDRPGGDALNALHHLVSSLIQDSAIALSVQAHVYAGVWLRERFDADRVIYRRIALPFFETYWSQRFAVERFRFSAPAVVERAIEEALGVEYGIRLQTLLRSVVDGIGMHAPPAIRRWLQA